MTTEQLRARLEASRASLLAALQGLTDRDFAAELPPGSAPIAGETSPPAETIVTALAAVARGEREAVREARAAVAAPARPLPAGGGTRTRPLPPQVMHDLAGARYETLLLLDQLDAGTFSAPADDETAISLLAGIAQREEEMAARIAGHRAEAVTGETG